MFRTTVFYDNLNNYLGDSWKSYLMLGVLLSLSAIVIFVMPEILAFIFATFLLWGGIFLFFLAYRLRKMSRRARYERVRVWRW